MAPCSTFKAESSAGTYYHGRTEDYGRKKQEAGRKTQEARSRVAHIAGHIRLPDRGAAYVFSLFGRRSTEHCFFAPPVDQCLRAIKGSGR